MNKFTAIAFGFILILFAAGFAAGQRKNYEELKTKKSPELQTALNFAVNQTIDKSLTTVKPDEIAVTLIDLSNPADLESADYKGDLRLYPASVVKMFYMVALFQWVEDGKVKLTPEIERGLKDMIEVSSNDATHFIFDVLTQTGGGAELTPKELKDYSHKKNAVNRYFQSLGYKDINVNQKTYCEDIYGRERQFWDDGNQRNKLTTNAVARLMTEIALGRAVSREKSGKMLELMKRDPFSSTDDKEDQAHGFTGISLIDLDLKQAKLWSKAGYTSSTRHDAALIEIPGGIKFVIVIFTQNHADQREIIPGIASSIIKYLQGAKTSGN